MKTRAYAKINLSLDIVGVRQDGYHTLKSIFLPISLYDELEINISKKESFTCNKKYVHYNKNNTIYKAIYYMKKNYDIKDNFSIKLNKVIPSQAGLGGGSSDGAMTIKLLNRMYHLRMSKKEISDACLYIGADTLFMYYHKPAYVESIGEKIRFINVKDDYYVLLIKPKGGVSTKKAYELLDINKCDHPDIDKLIKCLNNGKNIDSLLKNSLEKPSIELLPAIKNIKDMLIENGAPNALMTGSGSCVFVASTSKEEIDTLYNKLISDKYFIRKTKVLNNNYRKAKNN